MNYKMVSSEKPPQAKIVSLKHLIGGDAVMTIETANSVRYAFTLGPSQAEIVTQLVSDVVSVTQMLPTNNLHVIAGDKKVE